METHARTILKSLTWRLVAFTITTLIALVLTGKLELAATIGVVDTMIKLAAYYFHERAWLKIPYGKMHPPEYQI